MQRQRERWKGTATVQGWQEPPAFAGRGKEGFHSLHSGLLAPRTVIGDTSIFLSHHVCADLLQKPKEIRLEQLKQYL